ncbi:hypothetical protein ASG89_32265 [Paenibacillus sp. Soil766]|uniref:hypothetical protein n=1 Tax=Paenibacillus sp. Soil766 TaxID=1736404 RepID=UPI00070D5D76|nr:hypothetical protein [Paenibacillus sp. Soil766]KRE94535.1 hypothetical protein ASG89_32265 [Paenibacillus sp. Soil766]
MLNQQQLKVLPTDPWAFPESLQDIVVLECSGVAHHRHIFEYRKGWWANKKKTSSKEPALHNSY